MKKEITVIEETQNLFIISRKLVYGSILGLLFVVFLPLVGLGMLGWLICKRFC
jgi:hypothetical protein